MTVQMSKSSAVYEELRDGIVNGRYSPGYRLTLSTLAREFGVSTVPVREAIRWLQAEGLVEYTHNVGAQVSQIDISGYAESFATLAYLEGVATGLAAKELSADQIARARGINAEMRYLVQANQFDAAAYRRLNGKFHSLLCSACPNTRVLTLLTAEAERVTLIRRSSFSFDSKRSSASVEQHSHLLDLIESGADAETIEAYARQHKLASLERSLHIAAT
ncbi:GntR family transcriptional regulator [Trueperella pecoris]|uniref:GntR family transcriptional regulator n=1 Tax=Trueperella pecoris TaxID=2733571 RepID=A0A7M1QW72_9ACTO|nr:GntR family transcriptional regulator [Trueperella pecoris]QOQ39610.1 GntR family transcriptional regulator [Trueperella pecoris]QOR45764.1 GntR family transcriptional regulator [Trueperella pecoris]QTG75604.1 GntR family transcriptional regulator [Trueperella pecoris]